MWAMRVFDRWRALDGRAKRLSLEAALLTAIAAALVTLGRAPRLLRSTAPRGATSAQATDLQELTAAVARASRYLPGATCLARALALAWMLKRRGIAADVRLGVRTDTGRLFAHAWVECQGTVLGGPAAGESFVPIR